MREQYERYKGMVEEALTGLFPEQLPQKTLTEAMGYSLLAGGKRIRPVLVLAFCQAAGGDPTLALPGACAVEMLHTYSLIHDDLPCMDNDDLRRGKPTNHVVYGACTATLAGDALQAEAFAAVLDSPALPASRRAEMALYLARAAGVRGICGGQILDMQGEGKSLGLEELENIHLLKTASLLQACCKMGVAAAGGTREQLAAADAYARHVGLAFQIADDLLDVTSTTETLGKPVGSDADNHKTTYVTLLGAAACRERIDRETELAVQAIRDAFDRPGFLLWLAQWLARRER